MTNSIPNGDSFVLFNAKLANIVHFFGSLLKKMDDIEKKCIFAFEKLYIMCTYSITLSDTLIEQARHAIGADIDISKWMQLQMETILIRLATSTQHNAKDPSDHYAPDLETILAMPLLDNQDVGLNGENIRMDCLTEKYTL